MFHSDTKILIIDDFSTMRKIIREALTDLGLKNVIEADDGSTAWSLLHSAHEKRSPFELILSDTKMPTMCGVELFKKLQTHSEFSQIPFIIFTTETDREGLKTATSAGVSECLIKPFSVETLERTLFSVWQKAHRQAA